MIILHIIESFAPGISHFVKHLTMAFPDHENIVVHGERPQVASAESVKKDFPAYVRFIRWHHAGREIRPLKDLKALLELYRITKNMKPDVVHLHSSKAGFLGRILGPILGWKNVIYTPNGAAFTREDVSSMGKKMYIVLERIADKLCGRVICSSRSERDAYVKVGIEATYINNATEDVLPEDFPTNKVPSDTLNVVTSGRLSNQKNPSLFDAIAHSFSKNPNLSFTWIGDGELRESLQSKNIQITGWLSRKEVLAHVAQADVYLSTSLWEGLPYSVLEALALGKCVVLSDCVGNRDLVEHGKNGFLYSTEHECVDVLKRISLDKNIAQQMGLASREKFEAEFTLSIAKSQYEKEYERGKL